MNKNTITHKVLALATTAALFAPAYVLAEDAAGAAPVATKAEVRITAKTEKQRAIGGREIDRRVEALNAMVARVGDLKRLNEEARKGVVDSLNAHVQALGQLKAKIAADTDEATLKEDVQSITTAYRVFALVIPQGRIVIAADTIVYVSDALLTVGAKLDARIKTAEAAGKDVAALKTQLQDLGAKATDAKTQAQAAIELIAVLQPDGGDKTIMASNTKAMTDARAKLKVAQDDLKAARADAGKIATALKQMKLDAPAAPAAPAGTPAQ